MLRSILFASVLAGVLAAQRPILYVGGANPTHPNLAAAVAAAPPGAIIIVGPGSWQGFETTKPLTILLDFTSSNGTMNAPPNADYTVAVHDLPIGSEFVLKGRGAYVRTGRLGAIRVTNCVGTVSLEGLSVVSAAVGPALEIRNTSVVNVQHATLLGAPALLVTDGLVSGHDCAIAGSGSGVEGIVAMRSNLDLALGGYAGAGTPAIRCYGGWLRMAGDGATPVRVLGAVVPTSAIEVVDVGVLWDPGGFTVTPAGGAPPLLALGSTVGTLDAPSLAAACAGIGSTATTVLSRRSSGAGLIVFGGRITTPLLSTVGYRWLEPTLLPTVIAVGAVTPAGLGAQIVIPQDPLLLGSSFGVQGAVLQGSLIVESNPAHWTVL
jgi:hypothetical protein